MLRKRKPRSHNRRSSPTSIFRLHESRTKNIFLYVCLFQGLVILSAAGYIVQYHFWLLEDTTTPVHAEEFVETSKDFDKDGFKNKISELIEEFKTEDERTYSYTMFRFDKFRNGNERELSVSMNNAAGELVYFSKDVKYSAEDIPVWMEFKSDYEPERFEEYGGRVVHMKDVQINPSLGYGKLGGEEVTDVLNQPVSEEFLTLQKGYFMYKTKHPFECILPVSADIQKLAKGLLVEAVKQDQKITVVNMKNKVAIVTVRHDFANFYHSTMNLYDVFLIMVIFKINSKDVDIIWVDAHPRSKLDDVWKTLYGQPIRAGSLIRPVTYREMFWNGFASHSHINSHKFDNLPFVNEFRHYVLTRFAVPDTHRLNCDSVIVTIVWRRDHLIHPRNPSGFVSRKIENEEELWAALKDSDASLVVNGVQLDEISMEQQLLMIAETDILIGMHGAGLTHVLYLPQTSGLIELYPRYFSPANAHFRSMAKWRRIAYMNWVNDDKARDSRDHKTQLPTKVLQEMVGKMKKVLCENIGN